MLGEQPVGLDRLALRRLPSWIPGVATILALGGLTWALFSRAFLNYDTLYMLVWGRDLIHGRSPDYDVTLAPTPHPLAEAGGQRRSGRYQRQRGCKHRDGYRSSHPVPHSLIVFSRTTTLTSWA